MAIDIQFRLWSGNGNIMNTLGSTKCTECNQWTSLSYTKPVLCKICRSVVSEYSPYVARTLNSRLLYYNNKRGVL